MSDFPKIISVDDHVDRARRRLAATACPPKYQDIGPRSCARRSRR